MAVFARRADLPEPGSLHRMGDALVTTYCAKNLHTPRWRTGGARRLVAQARQTYALYGRVPLFDAYDRKAAVYLARIVSSSQTVAGHLVPAEEWVTVRFVPAAGTPPSNEDLDFYVRRGATRSDGGSIRDLLAQRSDGMSTAGAVGIFAVSRLCAIRPRTVSRANQPLTAEGVSGCGSPGNQHVPMAFAVLTQQFLRECERQDVPVDLITGQLHAELAARVLAVPPTLAQGTAGLLPFVPAHEWLGIKRGEVRLHRQSPQVYAYRYPGYFLDVTELAVVLRALVTAGRLTTACLERYLPPGSTLEQLLGPHPRRAYFACLGDLLTMDGPLPHSTLTGQELRAILDERVGDGPMLRLAARDELRRALDCAVAAHAVTGTART